jgi:hypothetical protein
MELSWLFDIVTSTLSLLGGGLQIDPGRMTVTHREDG